MRDFELAVKSTIDKKVSDIASAHNLPFVDLDDAVNTAEVLTSNESCLVWRFINLDEDPADPMYSLTFVVGVKTSADPSNYGLLTLVSAIKETFKTREWMDVMDYSSVVFPTVVKGQIYITSSGVDQQVMDRESGARMLSIEAKCLRNV